jgi:hypothetical protein
MASYTRQRLYETIRAAAPLGILLLEKVFGLESGLLSFLV